MTCSLRHEDELRRAGACLIAGVDEAGRGPLAGPVVAAAVVLPPGFSHPVLNDSKQLSAPTREALYAELTALPGVLWATALAEPEEIDRINILRATHAAMREAVLLLPQRPGHALIDGRPVRPFPTPATALVKGDAQSYSIAAASILAKVTRDRLMLEAHAHYPEYGFAQHKGYGTAEHLAKLKLHGPSPIHRRSFLPVREAQMEFL